ncbi:hypothetical protein [Micromonospora sp. NPDC005652]|uniref:hypothetical protein n=1 Tax=Micromonospora sp. NPDC005652 TaxID=3157046 RepID=UPI0033FF6C5A
MADQHRDTLLDIAAPDLAPGAVCVLGGRLRTALDRLSAFPAKGHDKTACRYLWLYAASRRLVGLATDLAVTAQIDLPLAAGDGLPHLGITVEDYRKHLAKPLGKAKSVVTLGAADGQLTLTIEGDDVAKVDARIPTPIDTDVLRRVGDMLVHARAAAVDSELTYGYAAIRGDLYARFGANPAGVWYAPSGRAYVEVDADFRGYVQPARARAYQRPLPAGQVLPAIPTERTAA